MAIENAQNSRTVSFVKSIVQRIALMKSDKGGSSFV